MLTNNNFDKVNISNNINFIIKGMDLTKLSKTELLAKCEEYGITKCKSKNKNELIEEINNIRLIKFVARIRFNLINFIIF